MTVVCLPPAWRLRKPVPPFPIPKSLMTRVPQKSGTLVGLREYHVRTLITRVPWKGTLVRRLVRRPPFYAKVHTLITRVPSEKCTLVW